nr:hypothetical protein CFP56_54477 [Quercus suber]
MASLVFVFGREFHWKWGVCCEPQCSTPRSRFVFDTVTAMVFMSGTTRSTRVSGAVREDETKNQNQKEEEDEDVALSGWRHWDIRSITRLGFLSTLFAHSRLRTESTICYDPCDAYANLDDDAGWIISDSPTSDYRPSASTTFASIRSSSSSHHRSARQSHARLLCSSAHRHDIAALVARMVQSRDQCSVVAHTELHPSELVPGAEDEGYDSSEMDDGETSYSRRSSRAIPPRSLEYRRSSDMRCGSTCVNKTTRFRKRRNHARRRTADK